MEHFLIIFHHKVVLFLGLDSIRVLIQLCVVIFVCFCTKERAGDWINSLYDCKIEDGFWLAVHRKLYLTFPTDIPFVELKIEFCCFLQIRTDFSHRVSRFIIRNSTYIHIFWYLVSLFFCFSRFCLYIYRIPCLSSDFCG